MQLSLWDETPVKQELPQVLYLQHSWADGDEDPDQMVRLSHVILGDIAMFDRSDGSGKEVYRVTTTGIVDGQVIAVYEYLCSAKQFYGGSMQRRYSESGYDLQTEGGIIPVYAPDEDDDEY
jgi:hypothetical protein